MYFTKEGTKNKELFCYGNKEPRPRHRTFCRYSEVQAESLRNRVFCHRVKKCFTGPKNLSGDPMQLDTVNSCEKPILLYASLLSKICNKGTLISLTSGSFSSVIAAHCLGWNSIGCERSLLLFCCGIVRASRRDIYRWASVLFTLSHTEKDKIISARF